MRSVSERQEGFKNLKFWKSVEAVEKRPSAATFYVRLIPRDLSALCLDSPPCGRVPGFGSLASGHFPSASQKTDFDSFTELRACI